MEQDFRKYERKIIYQKISTIVCLACIGYFTFTSDENSIFTSIRSLIGEHTFSVWFVIAMVTFVIFGYLLCWHLEKRINTLQNNVYREIDSITIEIADLNIYNSDLENKVASLKTDVSKLEIMLVTRQIQLYDDLRNVKNNITNLNKDTDSADSEQNSTGTHEDTTESTESTQQDEDTESSKSSKKKVKKTAVQKKTKSNTKKPVKRSVGRPKKNV